MKQFFEDYGKAILAIMVFIGVTTILFNVFKTTDGKKGIFSVIGEKAQTSFSDENSQSAIDASATNQILSRKKPTIEYIIPVTNDVLDRILANTPCNLNNYIVALDQDGNPATGEITDILDSSGNSIYIETKEDGSQSPLQETTSFLFPHAGEYTLKVIATDSYMIYNKQNINIAVLPQ